MAEGSDVPKKEKNFKLPYSPKYEFIENEERAKEVLDILSKSNVLAVDTETTGLDPYTSRILLLQIAVPDMCYILDCTKVQPNVWNSILSNPKILKIFQNAKFDYKMLKVHAKVSVRNIYDTMIAELILTAGRARKFISLAALARKYLGMDLNKEIRKDFVDRVVVEFSKAELMYSANDALILHGIYEPQVNALKRDELINVAVLEFNTVIPLAEMELSGTVLDKEKWRKHLAIARQKRIDVELKIKKALMPVSSQLSVFGECTINLNSNKQLLKALNDLGLKVEDTSEMSLKRERHKVIDWLLEWRGWNTILERYGESLLELTNPKTGRVHPEFIQMGAATGRMASSNYNAQNIPRYDPKDPNSLDLRSCFIAPSGYKVVVSDFSQQ